MLTIYLIIAALITASLTAFVSWNNDYDVTSVSDVLVSAILWPLLALLLVTELATSYIKERVS